MYAPLVVSLAFIGFCSARPAQADLFQPGSGLLDGPSMGFPAQYLPFAPVTPSRSDTPDEPGNLTLPINIHNQPDFKPTFVFGFYDAPNGFVLVTSIAFQIYFYWRDTANLRIRNKVNSRTQPFSNFLHIIQPSSDRTAVLTPLKIGLGYCFMLQNVQTQQIWPGHIRESIYDESGTGTGRQRVLLGTINIDNSPLRGPDTAAATSPAVTDGPKPDGSADDSNNLPMSVAAEKRWIDCFTRVLFSFLHYPAPGKVTDEPLYAPRSDPITYHYTFHGDAHFDFTVYPAGNAGGRHALTWDTVVRSMVSLVTTAARFPFGHTHIEVIKDAGVEIAGLRLTIAASP
ncbi:MAG: hypothetical protein Q9181_003813 [Wetmoreana brouardii]